MGQALEAFQSGRPFPPPSFHFPATPTGWVECTISLEDSGYIAFLFLSGGSILNPLSLPASQDGLAGLSTGASPLVVAM